MKAIVIGGCGHIGSFLVPMLIQAGYQVTAISRGTVSYTHLDVYKRQYEQSEHQRCKYINDCGNHIYHQRAGHRNVHHKIG